MSKKDEVGETIKKIVLSFVSLGLFAGLAVDCSSDQEKKMSHKTSKESTEEVTSGASANGYTDISELKDSYDVVIVDAGGAGMTAAL